MLEIHDRKVIPALIKLGRLFFNILIAAHFIGCIFLGLAVRMNDDNNWINKYNPEVMSESWDI